MANWKGKRRRKKKKCRDKFFKARSLRGRDSQGTPGKGVNLKIDWGFPFDLEQVRRILTSATMTAVDPAEKIINDENHTPAKEHPIIKHDEVCIWVHILYLEI